MARIQSQNGNENNQTRRADGAKLLITAELVQQVSDRVYELWRDDLRLERERLRITRDRWRRR